MPSHLPGMILGYRKNGSPIRLIVGGSEPATSTSMANPPDDEPVTNTDNNPSSEGSSGPTPADIARLQGALEKERANAKANAAAAKELAALKASQQSDTEKAIATARAEAAKEVSGRYTQRIASLSIRAAAGGKFQNPDDATALLSGKLGDFVNDDGEVNDKAVQAAVDSLLKDRPYLGVNKPPADFDGGQRNGATGTTDMNRLIRRQIGIQ